MFRRTAALCLLILLCTSAARAVDSDRPGEKDRCPVCGMFVAPHPHWAASALLKDGSILWFDGPKDLLRFYLDPAKYGYDRDRIARMRVMDYYSARPIPVEEAFFVIGSDVRGPMGEELVPVKGADLAETFRRDHGGARVLRFPELTAADIPR